MACSCKRLVRTSRTLQVFKSDLSKVTDPAAFDGQHELINEAVANHLYRHGQLHIAERLTQARRHTRARARPLAASA